MNILQGHTETFLTELFWDSAGSCCSLAGWSFSQICKRPITPEKSAFATVMKAAAHGATVQSWSSCTLFEIICTICTLSFIVHCLSLFIRSSYIHLASHISDQQRVQRRAQIEIRLTHGRQHLWICFLHLKFEQFSTSFFSICWGRQSWKQAAMPSGYEIQMLNDVASLSKIVVTTPSIHRRMCLWLSLAHRVWVSSRNSLEMLRLYSYHLIWSTFQ